MKTRQSLELTEAQIKTLNAIAAETKSLAKRGPKAGTPSWRVLIERIANGEITVANA